MIVSVCLAVIVSKISLLKGLAHNRTMPALYAACSKFMQSWGESVIEEIIARFLLGAEK